MADNDERAPLKHGGEDISYPSRSNGRWIRVAGGILVMMNTFAFAGIVYIGKTASDTFNHVHSFELQQVKNNPAINLFPSKFSVGNVTPRKSQGGRGTCWDFTTIGVLEWSYRDYALRLGYLQEDEYVSFSEQAFGIEIMKLCEGDPSSPQQILCHSVSDNIWNNSTEGGEAYVLYYLREGLKHALLPTAICPYIPEKEGAHECPGMDDALKNNPIEFEVKAMETYYDVATIKRKLVEHQTAMTIATPEVSVNHYYPCIGHFLKSSHCQPETCTACPPSVATTACCVPVYDDYNPNINGEYFAHPGMVFDDGHLMLLVGFNDEYQNYEGEVGGFIVKNSWVQSNDVGSHSLEWWMQEISDWDERVICPNSYNPNNWFYCGKQNPFSSIEVHDTFDDCISRKTRTNAKIAVQPLELECIDSTHCQTDKSYIYYLRNWTDWGDAMTIRCFWEHDIVSNKTRDFCLDPMLEHDIAAIISPKYPLPNDPDRCGFNFLSYDAVRQYNALYGAFQVNRFDINWGPSSFLANQAQYPSLNYTLVKKSTYKQKLNTFDGPHPYARIVKASRP